MEKENETVEPIPTATISIEAAQDLMDQLWYCGIRPVEANGSVGAMTAMKAHLEDMRKLVFEQPKSHQ